MTRKAKHDISPLIRGAFLKGFEEYCREEGITRSEAMKRLIADEGLIPVMNAVSKFAVRHNTVAGNVSHDHKHSHTHESVSDTLGWIEEITGGTEKGKATKPRPN